MKAKQKLPIGFDHIGAPNSGWGCLLARLERQAFLGFIVLHLGDGLGERVHDRHRLAGDVGVGVDLLEDLVDPPFRAPCLAYHGQTCFQRAQDLSRARAQGTETT